MRVGRDKGEDGGGEVREVVGKKVLLGVRLGKGIGERVKVRREKKMKGARVRREKNERGIKEREGGRVWRKLERL